MTSTEAIAAKDGIAFREIERNASLMKKRRASWEVGA